MANQQIGPSEGEYQNKEKILLRTSPSQYVNYNTFVFCAFLFVMSMLAPNLAKALGVPGAYKGFYMLAVKVIFFGSIIYAVWCYLKTRAHVYQMTPSRFSESSGVFSRKTDVLELYRVKDVTFAQPFTLRMFGLGNIIMETSDRSTPIVVIFAVKNGQKIVDMICHYVDKARVLKGVREVD